jgi:hypothetical protein
MIRPNRTIQVQQGHNHVRLRSLHPLHKNRIWKADYHKCELTLPLLLPIFLS